MLNFIKRSVALSLVVDLLIRHKLLNLSCPENDCGLESLDQVFVASRDVNIVEVFIRNVQEGLAFGLHASFIHVLHEVM